MRGESSESSESEEEQISFKRKTSQIPKDPLVEPTSHAKSRRLQSIAMVESEERSRVAVVESLVDDTDGLDDELEYKLWKQREINRVKREYAVLKEMDERAQQAHQRQNSHS